ncbi:MAG: peptidase [Acidobacteria bacterium]|nr:peptidase [Acidobacteriota bacterium]
MLTRARALVLVSALVVLASAQAGTRPVTTPEEHFGARIGDDHFLATYTQMEAYWKRLDRESDRMMLVDIGRTEEGRTQWMAVITAPEHFARLERFKEISRRLARAEGVTDDQARALAAEGKAVVWIDGGLHGNEVLSAQQLVETVYQLVSRSDDETERILRDVIVLAVHANPDGHELVAGWYMREANPRDRSLAGLPRLHQKYAGHDNNRDFYMATQAETINMSRILYREWVPQIVYNHHQADVPGAVMYVPPYREPSNYLFDPLVQTGITLAGAAMHGRFAAEGKDGVLAGSGSSYSTWWNGGLRTSAYFHNQIGLLTETGGSPTPGGVRFRRAVEYSVTANRAVLDLASRHREMWLYNVYRMGRNSIERGSRDSWTALPHRPVDPVPDPRLRDPRAYVMPSDQPDFLTATKFVNALIRTGVDVLRATAAFQINVRTYPAGSYVVRTAQAFRPHVLDMFEPQDYPDDVLEEGGALRPPYDSAGWTLAFQMGVRFDRILDDFDGPFERMVGEAAPPAGAVTGLPDAAGYLLSAHQNDAVIAVNRLLKAGERVSWRRDGLYVDATPASRAIVAAAAEELGLTSTGVTTAPAGARVALRPVRLGLVDQYGGWTTSGWIRWILERFEFPFEVVYPPALDAGNLAARYDVLILPSEAVPTYRRHMPSVPHADAVPAEYRSRIGEITVAKTVPALAAFVETGGTLLAIGGATAVARHLGLPVSRPLEHLPREEYFVPGSVLRAAVDPAAPLAYGADSDVDVFFDNSPVFRLEPGAAARGVRAVAWFDGDAPLRSGWAWGQSHLEGTAAIVDAPLGRGRVVLYGPEITFRAQSHGTFRFLFNGIYGAANEPPSH